MLLSPLLCLSSFPVVDRLVDVAAAPFCFIDLCCASVFPHPSVCVCLCEYLSLSLCQCCGGRETDFPPLKRGVVGFSVWLTLPRSSL